MGKKKKISEMTPEEQAEQRRVWAEDQAQRREEKRKAAYIPTAEEWRDEFAATEHHKTLNLHVKQFSAKVEEELGHRVGSVRVKTGHGLYDYFDDDGDYTVDRVARTLLGLKKNWFQEVRDPNGEQVSGAYFIDGCSFASSVIESVYRHDLKQSPIFAASLRELLELLNKRYARLRDQQTAVVRTELAGNYVLSRLFCHHRPNWSRSQFRKLWKRNLKVSSPKFGYRFRMSTGPDSTEIWTRQLNA